MVAAVDTRIPAPAARTPEPASVVIRRPAPRIVADPRPAVPVFPHPAAVAVRRPIRDRDARPPNAAVRSNVGPRAIRVKILSAVNALRDILIARRLGHRLVAADVPAIPLVDGRRVH